MKYLIIFEDGEVWGKNKIETGEVEMSKLGYLSIIDMENKIIMDREGNWILIELK